MKLSNKFIKNSKYVIKFVVTLLFAAFLLEVFGAKGLFGYIIIVSCFGLYKLWMFRSNLLLLIQDTETVLFGKPLEKEYWVGEKPKLRKMRFRK